MDGLKRDRLLQEKRQLKEWINNALEYKRDVMEAYGDNSEYIRTCDKHIDRLEKNLDKVDRKLENHSDLL
jgi:ribosome-associated translation inhibitor RaiA